MRVWLISVFKLVSFQGCEGPITKYGDVNVFGKRRNCNFDYQHYNKIGPITIWTKTQSGCGGFEQFDQKQ